ncbi:MAG: HAD-IIIA family hydrolase [Candidatus Omnitrophica bacterium]|nr:HAD-IIIA family hydrolase [Candidatus Omnitrophota bacterium]
MNKVIFLDRDGVINKDSFGVTPNNYVESLEFFQFADNAKEGIKALTEKGFDVIVISNQAGVSKGFYSEETLKDITDKMINEIEIAGGRIKKVFYCLHQTSDNCDCRKPKTGLFKQAQDFLGHDIKGYFFVGDTERDVIAGHSYGLKTIAVLTGKATIKDIDNWKEQPDLICKDLVEVAEIVSR